MNRCVLKCVLDSPFISVVPGIHRSFQQTTIVAEKNSGNLKVKIIVLFYISVNITVLY